MSVLNVFFILLRVPLVILITIGATGATLLGVFTFPVVRPLCGQYFYYRMCDYIADTYWSFMFWCAIHVCRVNWIFSGDDVPLRENAIVLASHRYWLDWMTVFALGYIKGRLGTLKIFAKDPIKFIPGFGWGIWILDSVFVKRDWARDREKINKTFARLRAHSLPFWMITHVEGTRFSLAKQKESVVYARKLGLPELQYCLLPRTKGFVATVNGLGDLCDAVYDLTIVYKHVKSGEWKATKGPTPWDFMVGNVFQRIETHVHIRRWLIDELPNTDEGLSEWCINVSAEKDKLLEEFGKNGCFPKQIVAGTALCREPMNIPFFRPKAAKKEQ